MRSAAVALFGVLITMTAGHVAGASAPPAFVISEGPYEVAEGDGGGVVELTVTNLMDSDLEVSILDTTGECRSVEAVTVPRRIEAAVEFTLATGCEIPADGYDVALEASSGASTDSLAITLEPQADSAEPDYRALWGFGFAALVGMFIALLINARGEVSLADPLPSIDGDWSFTESWASNLGLAAALFTGVFGATDVLESILGKAAPDLPVVVVAGAVTAGLVASGPLILAVFKHESTGQHTAGGVLAATTVVLTGNLGVVTTIWIVLQDHDALDRAVTPAAVIAALLLLVYTFRTVPRTIREGAAQPDPPPPTDAALVSSAIQVAGTKIAASIRDSGASDTWLFEGGRDVRAAGPPDQPVEPRVAPPRRRLTAMP